METGSGSSKNIHVKKENLKRVKTENRIMKRAESSDSESDDENNPGPSKNEFIWNTVLLVNNFSPQHAIGGWSMEALEKSLGSDYLRYFGKFVEPKMFRPGAKTWKEVFETPPFKPIFTLTRRQRHPFLFATEPIREGKIAKLAKMASYASCRLSEDPIFNMLLKLPPPENMNIDKVIAERVQQIQNFDASKVNKTACAKKAIKRQIMSLAANLPVCIKTINLSSDSEDDERPKKSLKTNDSSDNVVTKPVLTVAVPTSTLPNPVMAETVNKDCEVPKPQPPVPVIVKAVDNSCISQNPPPVITKASQASDNVCSTVPKPTVITKAADTDNICIVPKPSVAVDAVETVKVSKLPCTTSNDESVEQVEVPKTKFLAIEMPGFTSVPLTNTKPIEVIDPIRVIPMHGINNALQLILVSYNEMHGDKETSKEQSSSAMSSAPIGTTPIRKLLTSSRNSQPKPIDYSFLSVNSMFDVSPVENGNESPMDFSNSGSGIGLHVENVRSLALDYTSRFGPPQACSTQMRKPCSQSQQSISSQETITVRNSTFSESQLYSQRSSLGDGERCPGSTFRKERFGQCNTSRQQKEECSVIVVNIRRLCRDPNVEDLQDIFSDYGDVRKAMVDVDGRYGEIEMSNSSAMKVKQRLSRSCIVYEDGESVFSFQVRKILENEIMDVYDTSTLSARDYKYHPRTPNGSRLTPKVILEWDLKKYSEFADLM